MSFFVTSAGKDGANLGGLAGADKHCQTLAAAAGAGNRTWRAYLSASASGGQPAVNARDRIGTGPWASAKGIVVAQSVADLHSDITRLEADNARLQGEIDSVRRSTYAVERIAREDLGMSKKGEVVYMLPAKPQS